jgi:hypothetical protein
MACDRLSSPEEADMAAPDGTTGTSSTTADTGDVPIACALTSAGLAEQAGRWERLAARAMTGRSRTAHGLRIWFSPGPGVEEELHALVAVENECCPWAAWTVETSPARVMLDVRSAGAGVAVLRGMFSGLRPAPPAGPR